MGTENGSWGAVAGDLRNWLDDRLQTLVGVVYASVNLDFYGIGESSILADNPLRYNLEPKGGDVAGQVPPRRFTLLGRTELRLCRDGSHVRRARGHAGPAGLPQ